ncbi:MAG: hypothetical protein V3T17_19255 [Pseudomonadales bacterium]
MRSELDGVTAVQLFSDCAFYPRIGAMSILDYTNINAIYGVGKLGRLDAEFTRQTVFNTSRQFCVKPSIDGSFFGGLRKETVLNDKLFRILISKFYNTEEEIEGHLPVGKLFYFKAKNQDYYKTRAGQYFRLIKRHLIELDKKAISQECVWCFFPMYHTQHNHLTVGELSAYVMWFKKPAKPTAKIYQWNKDFI